jgi:hypothetical protein
MGLRFRFSWAFGLATKIENIRRTENITMAKPAAMAGQGQLCTLARHQMSTSPEF